MNFLTKYRVKIGYMKMDLIMRDITDITRNIDSAYIIPKRQLARANSLIDENQKKAVREMKKAKKLFIQESRVACEYNRYRDIIDETKNLELQELNSRYMQAIHEGDYKTASQIIVDMSVNKGIVEPPPRLKVDTEKTDETSVLLSVTNELDTNLLITSFNIISDDPMESDVHGTMVVLGKEKKAIKLQSDTQISFPIKIHIGYTVENEDRKITYTVNRIG